MSRQPAGIYVHIPYCIKKCPYCDFNSYAVGQSLAGDIEAEYLQALLTELEHYASIGVWHARTCNSIFFGGGTPSLFSPASIYAILEAIHHHFSVPPETEITLEANPGTLQEQLGAEKLRGFYQAGVNRISMGVQSFRDEKLATLGRLHSGGDVRRAVDHVRAGGFTNFNLDLIFGVATETMSEWEFDLRSAIDLAPRHLSAYSLTIEPGTEFHRLQRSGALSLPPDDMQARLYEFTQTLCLLKGYEQYEISNYALPGFQCQHNLGYWRSLDYLGIGAGAHSFLNVGETKGKRWSNLPGPKHYIAAVQASGHAEQRSEAISLENARLEFFLLGLRTTDGVSHAEYASRFGGEFSEEILSVFERYEQYGCLLSEEDTVRLTKKGFLFADGLLLDIAHCLEEKTEHSPQSARL